MRKQYLHLSAYPCDACAGPVIAGSLRIRENEISKETQVRHVGAICLSCGHKQDQATQPARACHLPPVEWGLMEATEARPLVATLVQAINGTELH